MNNTESVGAILMVFLYGIGLGAFCMTLMAITVGAWKVALMSLGATWLFGWIGVFVNRRYSE
jgi:hypothetical protein